MKRVIALLALVAVLVGAAGFWYVQNSRGQGPAYRMAIVKRGDLSATISATGTLEPEEVVDVGAQVQGMIKKFGPDPRDPSKTVDYGSPMEAGSVLAHIDEAVYQAQVDQAQANVQRAEADLMQMKAKLTQAERDWDRARKLGPSKGVISGLDYDTTEATYLAAKSTLAVGDAAIVQAKAALKQAQINLDYCTIKSPVKGVIVDRRVNVGQTVVASLNAPSLFLIAKDLKRMQIWASVNEADIGQIKPGQPVLFTVDAYPGEIFKGEVAQVRLNATMTQNVVTYTVVVNFDNSSGKLLPYLTANLQFEVSQRRNVLLVPNGALRWQPNPKQVAPDARAAFSKGQKPKDPAVPEKVNPVTEAEAANQGTVWVKDGDFVRPVKVRIGPSDGSITEITSADVQENSEVITGMIQKTDTANTTTNPFTPQMFGGKKSS